MCKDCPPKIKAPKIPLEIFELGGKYFLISIYYNRIGMVGQYVSHADFYLENRESQINKLYPFEKEHKKIVNEILSNDYAK
jgi:hypothetical protein